MTSRCQTQRVFQERGNGTYKGPRDRKELGLLENQEASKYGPKQWRKGENQVKSTEDVFISNSLLNSYQNGLQWNLKMYKSTE